MNSVILNITKISGSAVNEERMFNPELMLLPQEFYDVVSQTTKIKFKYPDGNGSTVDFITDDSITLDELNDLINATQDASYGVVEATLYEAQTGTGLSQLMTPRRVRDVTQKVFNVKSYGALGDGRTVVDGGINSGTALLNSATANFTSADIDKIVEVPGAGSAGSELVTPILSINSSTQAVLSVSASTTVTNKKVWIGTDDTSAIQSAINACFNASGGKVYFPNGIYIINGALVTSDLNGLNPNSQLYIPASPTTADYIKPKAISIIGESFAMPWLDTIPYYGTILKSTLRTGTGTQPSVLGGKGFTSAPITEWNTTNVYFDNIGIFMATNGGYSTSNMIGYNGLQITTTSGKNFGVKTDCNTYDTNMPTPVGSGFTGMIIGNIDNIVASILDNVNTAGAFEYGIVLGEHIYPSSICAVGSYYGVTFLKSNFAVIGNINVGFCVYPLYFPNVSTFVSDVGTSYVDITLEVEAAGIGGGPSWLTQLATIKDSGNYARGTIKTETTGTAGDSIIGGLYAYIIDGKTIYQKSKPHYPREGNTAYFDFEESSGVRYSMDSHGFQNSLTPTGAVARVAGVNSYGVQFPAGTIYLEGSTNNSLSASENEFSFNLWVRRDAYTQNNSLIVGKWDTGQKEWALYWTNDTMEVVVSADGTTTGAYLAGSAVLTIDSTFHHIAVTWDGFKIYLYVDGVLYNSDICTGIFNKGTAPLRIAKDIFGSGTNFRGTVDLLLISKKHLTANDVSYLYNNGQGRARPILVNETDTTWTGKVASLPWFADDAAADAAAGGTAPKSTMYYNITIDKIKIKENTTWKTITTS